MTRVLAGPAGVVAYVIGACLVTLAWFGVNVPESTPAPVESSQLAPCAREYSPGPCVWDAATRGNGRGTSFIRDADGMVTHEPYGGCDESSRYPGTAGAAWCAEAGLS